MTLSPYDIAGQGSLLWNAWRDRTPIAPQSEGEPRLSIDEAYAVQREMLSCRRAATGEAAVGWKIGVTSPAAQKMLRTDEPNYGQLLSGMVHEGGATLPAEHFIAPRVEAEIAFRLASDLKGPGVTARDVMRATGEIVAAIEVADSRIKNWKISFPASTADNAAAGAAVLGNGLPPAEEPGLGFATFAIERNGEPVASGTVNDMLGDPAEAVAWLANKLGASGVALQAGDVILSGALAPMAPVKPGDQIQVTIEGIGTASASFV